MLTCDETSFRLHGKKFHIYSGAMHYFRILPQYWEDRLQKLKAAGFNTVETYVCWNLHEPQKGQFDFSGRLDLVRFLETAQKVGLYALVRRAPTSAPSGTSADCRPGYCGRETCGCGAAIPAFWAT